MLLKCLPLSFVAAELVETERIMNYNGESCYLNE